MRFFFSHAVTLGLLSTHTTSVAPLEINSKLKFPVPVNKSNTRKSEKSIWLPNTLKSPSFAKSVVGRDGKLEGTAKDLPFK